MIAMQSKGNTYWLVPILSFFAICTVAAQSAPSLSGLSSDDRDSIEMACSVDKNLHGPAAYHDCLNNKLTRPVRPFCGFRKNPANQELECT
jgi:hypothetical protein